MSNNQISSSSSSNDIVTRLIKSTYIRSSLDEMSDKVTMADQQVMDTNDFIKTKIIQIASFFEENFTQAGLVDYVSDISSYIYQMMSSRQELEKQAYLTYRALDDKYKNKNKDSYKKQVAKINQDRCQQTIESLENVDLTALDTEYLRKLKARLLSVEDLIDREVVQNRQEEIYDGPEVFNDLAFNSENEKYKFEKAEMSEPIATVEEKTEDREYKEYYDRMVRAIDRIIEGYHQIKANFTEKYIPLSLDTCKKACMHFELQLEYIRPYFDKKYRMDHWQMLKAVIEKEAKSSAAAAKSTAVPCLLIKDRNGNTVFRNMTKEQLEAVYDWEFNFWVNLINDHIRTPELIEALYKEHLQRAIADRQVKLNKTLQHFA
jgi:hypothetical protein